MATMSTSDLIEVFKSMTVLELSDFKKAFEEAFDVTAAAPMAMMAAPAAGGGAAEAAEKQTVKNVEVNVLVMYAQFVQWS